MSSMALRCLLLRRIPGPLLLPRRVPAPPPAASRSTITTTTLPQVRRREASSIQEAADKMGKECVDDLRRVGYAGAAALAGFTLLVATMTGYQNRRSISSSRP